MLLARSLKGKVVCCMGVYLELKTLSYIGN